MPLTVRFEQLAKELHPSKEFIKQGNILADMIFKVLGSVKGLSIAKCVIAGSMGRKTALNEDFEPDFDLVVLMNSDYTMNHKKRNDVLEQFVSAVKTASDAGKLPEINITRTTRYSVQFVTALVFDGQLTKLEIDLLPAINFGKNPVKKVMNQIQLGNTNGSITGDVAGDLVYSVSPSLAEETVSFLKEIAEPSTRGVILVAKYWDRVVKEKTKHTVTSRVSGRSYIIELIAIHSNSDLQGLPPTEKNSVYYGFIRFLKTMEYLDKLSVTFFDKYEDEDVPISVMMEKLTLPFVLDPVNCWNNLGKQLHGFGVVDAYKKFATGTLQALRKLEQESPTKATLAVDKFNINNFHEFIVSA